MGYFFSFQQQLPEKHQLAAASTYPAKVISCKSFGEVFIWKKKLEIWAGFGSLVFMIFLYSF